MEQNWEEKRGKLKKTLKQLLDKKDYKGAWEAVKAVVDKAGNIERNYFDDEMAALFHLIYSVMLQYILEGKCENVLPYENGQELVQKIEEIKFILRRMEWDISEEKEALIKISPYMIETLTEHNILNKNKVYRKMSQCYFEAGKEDWAKYLYERVEVTNRDVCFILCTNDEFYCEECLRYIESLYVPDGTKIEIVPVRNAPSMTAGYNFAMKASKAKYKVYLHQDTFIVNKNFIVDIIRLFEKDETIGMIGLAGSRKHPANGVWWNSKEEDCLCEIYQANLIEFQEESFNAVEGYPYEIVESVDGVLLVTSVDIPWREDLFDGWHFYDISQSFEMRRRGYKVIIPACDPKWVIHEVGCSLELDKNYEQYRLKFLKEYEIDMRGEMNMYTSLIHKLNPKPKFNLNWYKGEDLYSEGDIEDLLIKLIAQNEPENYTRTICENFSWSTYYHLTHLRKNILNWYPFEKEASVLEIGCGLGAITGVLCDKCKKVTAVELSKKRATATLLRCREKENLEIIVGNLNDIEFEEQYDYITLIGVLEYQGNYTNTDNPYLDFLKKIKKLLKPNGKLLIAIENQYGLKYWCGAREDHTGIPFEGINQYTIANNGARTFSREALKKLVIDSGFSNAYFYYPMPDYKLPTVIYSEECLPKNTNLQDIDYYYAPNSSTLIANEQDIYKDIVENNTFEFFANSFLVECSDDTEIGKVTFVNISSKRVPEYRIGTQFVRNGKVEKYMLDSLSGTVHLAEIQKNERNLKQRGLHIWENKMENGKLVSDFTDALLLEDYLIEAYSSGQKEKIYAIYDKVYEEILKSSKEVVWQENSMYSLNLGILPDKEKYGPILQVGYLDMILRNAFFIDEEIYWFDQEWVLENVPAKYVLYRVLIMFYSISPDLNKILSLDEVAAHYGLLNIWGDFQQLETLFIKIVMGDELLLTIPEMKGRNRNTCISNISKIMN